MPDTPSPDDNDDDDDDERGSAAPVTAPVGGHRSGGDVVPTGHAGSDDEDLSAALTALAGLTTGGPLEASLTRIATLAAVAIPGAEGAGLTMLESGRPQTVVVSAPFVQQVDDVQYGIGQGPCITAATEARTVISGSLGADPKWPQFGPRAQRLGVHSALSLPLLIGDETLGALNIYAHPRDVFTAHAAQLGELFAIPAAVAVFNARTLMQAQRLAGQLETALSSRAVVDQAIGILISRQGGSAEDAFASLRTISQRDNTKLSIVAQSIVSQAALRARARRTDES